MYAMISEFNGSMAEIAESRLREQFGGADGERFQQNMAKNRYNNIVPYTATQPVDFYFNGNVVDFSVGGCAFEFLVSYAPVDLDDYYAVIRIFKPSAVVQVSRFADQFVLKAERYIPLAPVPENVEILRNAVVASRFAAALRAQLNNAPAEQVERCASMDCGQMQWHCAEMRLRECCVRTASYEEISTFYRYKVVVEQSGASYTDFIYYYYPKWTDFAAPDSFHEVFALCTQIHGMRRILVHCSAGIGRSATFCICYVVFEQFRLGLANKPAQPKQAWQRLQTGILDIIEQFRTKRHPYCVQTVEQFKFILEFCNYCSEYDFK